jgi:molybdenum cofactor synthesis domain-containing protein
MYQAIVVTVSDRCARGEWVDASGPAVREILERSGFAVMRSVIVPDERPLIERALIEGAEEADLIVTTGGTGFSPRDVTPEATQAVCERMAPGIPEAMRAASLKITPLAMLSRAAAGIRGHCLIVNLPGSVRAARENLEAVAGALTHGIDMLRGGDHPKQPR